MTTIQSLGWIPVDPRAMRDIEQGNLGQIKKREFENQILTIETDKGVFRFYAPELDRPDRVTTADMANAMRHFSELGNPDSDAFADVFRLMTLLFEALKVQRGAAREARNTERDRQMAEIDKQVSELKAAAATAMITGLASAAVTLGMASFSAAKLAGGMKQQFQVNRVEQFQVAKARLETANLKVDALKLDATKLNGELTVNQQKIGGLTTEIDKTNRALGVLKEMQVKDPGGYGAETVQTKRVELETKLGTLNKELDAAKSVQANLEIKAGDLAQQLKRAEVLRGDAQQNFEDVSKKMTQSDWALWDKEEQSSGKLKEASLEADQKIKHVDILNMITQALSQGTSGVGQGIQGMRQAAATEHEGESRQADYKAQEEVEWMQDMRDAIKTLLDKYQAILQSQTDSMRTINRV